MAKKNRWIGCWVGHIPLPRKKRGLWIVHPDISLETPLGMFSSHTWDSNMKITGDSNRTGRRQTIERHRREISDLLTRTMSVQVRQVRQVFNLAWGVDDSGNSWCITQSWMTIVWSVDFMIARSVQGISDTYLQYILRSCNLTVLIRVVVGGSNPEPASHSRAKKKTTSGRPHCNDDY